MSITRTHKKTKNFSVLDNEAPNNSELSFRARGILWHLLTKPDGWTAKISALTNASGKEGRESIRTAFKELIDAGYAYQQRGHDPETGRIVWITEIFETKADRDAWLKRQNLDDTGKVTMPQKTVYGSAVSGSPVNGSAIDGKPDILINTDRETTLKEKTELSTTTTTTSDEGRGGCERESSLFDLDKAKKIAEYVAGSRYGGKVLVRHTKALEKACAGHTHESARLAVWAAFEEHETKGIKSWQAYITKALKEGWEPTPDYIELLDHKEIVRVVDEYLAYAVSKQMIDRFEKSTAEYYFWSWGEKYGPYKRWEMESELTDAVKQRMLEDEEAA